MISGPAHGSDGSGMPLHRKSSVHVSQSTGHTVRSRGARTHDSADWLPHTVAGSSLPLHNTTVELAVVKLLEDVLDDNMVVLLEAVVAEVVEVVVTQLSHRTGHSVE